MRWLNSKIAAAALALGTIFSSQRSPPLDQLVYLPIAIGETVEARSNPKIGEPLNTSPIAESIDQLLAQEYIGDYYQSETHQALYPIFKFMRQQHLSTMLIELDGTTSTLTRAYNFQELQNIFQYGWIIAETHAPFLETIYGQMLPGQKELVQRQTDYIIFSPNIGTNLFFNTITDVGALPITSRIIGVDTNTYDGEPEEAILFPSWIVHELSHLIDHQTQNNRYRIRDVNHHSRRSYGLNTAESEECATKSEIEVLRHQILLNPEPDERQTLIESLHYGIEKMATARFLLQFGKALQEVYPQPAIYAQGLLDAGVSSRDLQRFMFHRGEDERATELRTAARLANLVLYRRANGQNERLDKELWRMYQQNNSTAAINAGHTITWVQQYQRSHPEKP